MTPPSPPVLAGVRVGCDVVTTTRFVSLLERRPGALDRLFTLAEQRDAVRDGVAIDDEVARQRLAARFAAKEAAVKLLARPRLAWTDVEVLAGDDGAPRLWLRGTVTEVAVSLSHDGGVAMAVLAVADAATLPPLHGT